jgi:HEAT repeat protein
MLSVTILSSVVSYIGPGVLSVPNKKEETAEASQESNTPAKTIDGTQVAFWGCVRRESEEEIILNRVGLWYDPKYSNLAKEIAPYFRWRGRPEGRMPNWGHISNFVTEYRMTPIRAFLAAYIELNQEKFEYEGKKISDLTFVEAARINGSEHDDESASQLRRDNPDLYQKMLVHNKKEVIKKYVSSFVFEKYLLETITPELKTIESINQRLSSDNLELRERGLLLLAEKDKDVAVPVLLKHFNSGQDKLMTAVILAQFGNQRGIDYILHLPKIEEDTPHDSYLTGILGTMARDGNKHALQILIKFFEDHGSVVAMNELCKIDNPLARGALINAFDGYVKARREGVETDIPMGIIKAQGVIKNNEAVDDLIFLIEINIKAKSRLTPPRAEVVMAAWALAEIGDKKAIPVLVEAFDQLGSRAALQALIEFRYKRIIPKIEARLKKDPPIRLSRVKYDYDMMYREDLEEALDELRRK